MPEKDTDYDTIHDIRCMYYCSSVLLPQLWVLCTLQFLIWMLHQLNYRKLP